MRLHTVEFTNASEHLYHVATNVGNPLALAILEQLSLKCGHFVTCQKSMICIEI
jgi:hypothetical protein